MEKPATKNASTPYSRACRLYRITHLEEARPPSKASPAPRPRQEMAIESLRRPMPRSLAPLDMNLRFKTNFAELLILEIREAFGEQATNTEDISFQRDTQYPLSGIHQTGYILRQYFIRARLQAAVFDCFIKLCVMGVCSLNSLKHPVNWSEVPQPGSCCYWILRMFECFAIPQRSWSLVQQEWEIPRNLQSTEYRAPFRWFAIMIARSFTDLAEILGAISATGQLGALDLTRVQRLVEEEKFEADWPADINLLNSGEWLGSGTFAFWLPENVDPKILELPKREAIAEISRRFYAEVEYTEMHYRRFFDIYRSELQGDTTGKDISK